ncbi:MAG TPA: hypothetical protein VJP40_07185 [bacterium]|nr:hypothetical protein [bacterium]
MSVLEAVTRAMRSGRVITPNEFPAIQRQALATVELSQMHPGDYLLRGEAAEALRGARFRNDAERRTFYVSFLSQARDRVLGQLTAAIAAIPDVDRTSRLGCFEVTGEGAAAHFTPASCFFSGGLGYGIRSGLGPTAGHAGFGNGLLRYLGETLPFHAFVGLPGSEEGFFEVQLLDGVQFNSENFSSAELPAETRINATTLRLMYRVNACSESSTLPDCAR